MQQLRVVTRITNIRDIKAFKELLQQAFVIANEEQGTLQYECYLSEDRRCCTHLETFKDAEAVAVHVVNVADIFQQVSQICDLHFEVLGESNDKIAELAKQFGAEVVPYFGGLRLA